MREFRPSFRTAFALTLNDGDLARAGQYSIPVDPQGAKTGGITLSLSLL
jgi:hypothetical protein